MGSPPGTSKTKSGKMRSNSRVKIEGAMTLGELMQSLDPRIWTSDQPPYWPPDLFAVAAVALHKCGGYRRVVKQWPPQTGKPFRARYRTANEWADFIKDVGVRWRESSSRRRKPPEEVQQWWAYISARRGVTLHQVSNNGSLCDALLQLCAAADEACEGVGIAAGPHSSEHSLEFEANTLLFREGATLCKRVDSSRARVLPKMHSPRNGLTIRSLSHNLALIPSGEVTPNWYRLQTYHKQTAPPDQSHSLNLLVIPWPDVVTPAQFKSAVPKGGQLQNMPDKFGFFTYVPRPSPQLGKVVSDLFAQASALVGRIDGVIFPELALNAHQYRTVAQRILRNRAFLISGIAETPTRDHELGANSLAFDVPITADIHVSLKQYKHHRWKLDKGQIGQYGIATELDPRTEWWEHIRLESRTLTFVSLRPWLTMTTLICEDLARQDPVADLVRAVGPNLVIALLLDAPQLATRWPARYATVLADDPGCSVLTVTSLGMSELSRPFGVEPRSRVVALWKDAQRGIPVEIELPKDKFAAVLNLTVENAEEYTADGRSDGGATGYPVLSGVHFV